MRRIGLVVNPIAGLGGRVGLKGTDGVVVQARAAGAEPVAGPRATDFAEAFVRLARADPEITVRWITCAGSMGFDALATAGVPREDIQIVQTPADETTSDDTRRAVEASIEVGAELMVFCGGDGTARDVAEAARDRVPILGVPAGVKMYSGVFAVSSHAAAGLLAAYVRGDLRTGSAEILDLDEEAYREGSWQIRLYVTAKTLVEPHFVQAGKLMVTEVGQEAIRAELAAHFEELFRNEPDTLFLLGPGTTLASIATSVGLPKSLLGIDAIRAGKVLATDVNEKGILSLLDRHPKAKVVVSPIGAQGFILGRGNLQMSPAVLRRIGTENVLVVATPEKLAMTPVLRVDTGDAALDQEFSKREYAFVLIGYRTSKLHPFGPRF